MYFSHKSGYHFRSLPIGLRVAPDLRDDLDAGGLVAAVGHVAGQLLVSEGVGGVRPEGQLRPEDGLALQPRALPDEQVVEVALMEEEEEEFRSLR